MVDEDGHQMMPQTLTTIERSNPPARQKACATCIKAKRRCNLGQPACLRCLQRRIQCRYQPRPCHSGSMQPSPHSISNPTTAKLVDPFEHADTLTMQYTGAVSDFTDMPPSCDPQSILLNDFSLPDFDHLSPELVPSSSLDSIDPLHGMHAADHEQLETTLPRLVPVENSEVIQTSFHLIPPRTNQLSLNAAFRNRLQYAIGQLTASPRRMVLENGTPWSHPLLYRNAMPRSIQDVHACCALYLAKNTVNAPVILSVLSSRASELVSQPFSSSPQELLARTQSLMLYSIMHLFDGDVQALKLAEQDMPALESAALALLPLITVPDPEFAPQRLSLYPLSTTREFWNDWIFQESARRTFFMTFFYLQIYRVLCGIPPLQCDGKLYLCHCWTMSAHLWGAMDAIEFAEAWGARRQFVVTNANFKAIIDDAMAEDVDDYTKMLLTASMGIDELKGWMLSRGGRL